MKYRKNILKNDKKLLTNNNTHGIISADKGKEVN